MNETDDYPEYDDFFGINNIKNEIVKCEYCGEHIALMPFVGNDLYFCDVICCKLYGDENNWKSYRFDKHTYDLYYKNQLLSATAMSTYQLLRKVDLLLLPHFNNNENISKITKKNKYTSVLSTYISHIY